MPKMDIGNNAIQFHNNPFMIPETAMTLGNTINYGDDIPSTDFEYFDYPGGELENVPVPLDAHERYHTYQYELYGPFFIPIYLLGGGPIRPSPLEYVADRYGYDYRQDPEEPNNDTNSCLEWHFYE